MSYEAIIDVKGGRVEVEADTVAQLEKRIAALDLRRIEDAIRRARAGGKPKKAAVKAARRR